MVSALERVSAGKPMRNPYTPHDPQEVALPAILAVAFACQSAVQWLLHRGDLVESLVLSPDSVLHGRWWTLVSYMFLHAGIFHLLMNASFAAVVTPSVMRVLGLNFGGIVRFALFFLVCGIVAGLSVIAFHPGSDGAVIGASGALSGLCGAAIRANLGAGDLAHPFSRHVWRAAAPFLLINVVMMGMLSRFGLPVAWQAHLGGFLAGLLLFKLFLPPATVLEPVA